MARPATTTAGGLQTGDRKGNDASWLFKIIRYNSKRGIVVCPATPFVGRRPTGWTRPSLEQKRPTSAGRPLPGGLLDAMARRLCFHVQQGSLRHRSLPPLPRAKHKQRTGRPPVNVPSFLVRIGRLELPLREELDPKSNAATNYAISAGRNRVQKYYFFHVPPNKIAARKVFNRLRWDKFRRVDLSYSECFVTLHDVLQPTLRRVAKLFRRVARSVATRRKRSRHASQT